MTAQCASNGPVFGWVQGGNAPMRSRLLSEVQITGIPKASMLEAASTA